MLGFVFGTVCLFGLVGMAHHAAVHRHAHAGCGGRGFEDGPRGHGFDRRFRRGRNRFGTEQFGRAMGEVFKRRLGIDDEQEPIVDHALKDLHAAITELADELRDTRGPIADAFRGDAVDEAALAVAFARHDDATQRARRQVVSALKQVHAVLEPEQRERAAAWIASGDGKWV